MAGNIAIVPEQPAVDGEIAGKALGAAKIRQQSNKALADPLLKSTLGAMTHQGLAAYVLARLETTPDFTRFPELGDLYPERLDYLRGVARGARCTLGEAALHDYLLYRREIALWNAVMNPRLPEGGCSGVVLIGPEGVLFGQNIDSMPIPPRPRRYRHRPPQVFRRLTAGRPQRPDLVLRLPRTGYIQDWGLTNECGLAMLGGGSCGTWLDEPIEDTWPIKHVPILRFARDVIQAEELCRRYVLFNWGRSSEIYVDLSPAALVVERSYRRIGVRRLRGEGAIWATEGHFQDEDMSLFLRRKRLEYVARAGKHLGAGDLQYATDCAVRFTHIGELCHQDWGRGHDHMQRIVTDHNVFPRAVCRHAGPDSDPYDQTVTLRSSIFDVSGNRSYIRAWTPWQRFACQAPALVTVYPPRPRTPGQASGA